MRPDGIAVDLNGGARGGSMDAVIEPKTVDFADLIARPCLPGGRVNSRTGS